MKPVYLSRAVLVVLLGLSAPASFAQQTLNQTDLGKSQNSRADLMNSLIVPDKPKFKGEKKEEVDPKKLTSKRSNDTTFSGSLNDIGLNWNMAKSQAKGDADSKSPKSSESAEKNSTAVKSADASGEAQSKEQKPAISKPEEKSEKQPDKQKSSDGDR